MSTEIRFRRGTTAQHAAFTGAIGEITVDTDKDVAVVHDGATAGGFPLMPASKTYSKADVGLGNVDNTSDANKPVSTAQQDAITSYSRSRKNYIINGNFDIWQRGTSQTSSGYGSDDRWTNLNLGTTKTHTRETFALGQTWVPGNPKYYSRTVVTSVVGSSNYCLKQHNIEGVASLSGKRVTLSFYAQSDVDGKRIAVEFRQRFGTGGSPSTTIDAIGSQVIDITHAWAKYSVTIDIPSITGKVLGTNGDDRLELNFMFDAGSSFNIRSSSLGQQSGTFDIAQVQLEEGSIATEFERRTYAEELALCKRYYQCSTATTESWYIQFSGNVTSGSTYWAQVQLDPVMRTTPISTLTDLSATNFPSTAGSPQYTKGSVREPRVANATGAGFWVSYWTADAEL